MRRAHNAVAFLHTNAKSANVQHRSPDRARPQQAANSITSEEVVSSQPAQHTRPGRKSPAKHGSYTCVVVVFTTIYMHMCTITIDYMLSYQYNACDSTVPRAGAPRACVFVCVCVCLFALPVQCWASVCAYVCEESSVKLTYGYGGLFVLYAFFILVFRACVLSSLSPTKPRITITNRIREQRMPSLHSMMRICERVFLLQQQQHPKKHCREMGWGASAADAASVVCVSIHLPVHHRE